MPLRRALRAAALSALAVAAASASLRTADAAPVAVGNESDYYTHITPAPGIHLHKRGPSNSWSVSLNSYDEIGNTAGNPAYHVFPDGQLTALPSADGGWQMIWANCENYRTVGFGPFPENQNAVVPWIPYPVIYFGGRTNAPGWANGGKWLSTAFRHPTDGNPRHLISFYHAEDGYWPYQGAGGPAWKSIGVVHSYDNGLSWTDDLGPILTSAGRPSDDYGVRNAVYGGIGNHGAVWDASQNRWVIMFASNPEHKFGIAVSYDPSGAPGTWFKWDGQGFNQPGRDGYYQPVRGIQADGANAVIHWNTVLSKWVAVYGGWDNCLHLVATSDFIDWDGDRLLTCSVDGSRAWYPTVVGPNGNNIGGNDMVLYHADRFQYPDIRHLARRQMSFGRND